MKARLKMSIDALFIVHYSLFFRETVNNEKLTVNNFKHPHILLISITHNVKCKIQIELF